MVKPRNNKKNKKINNQCDVPINFSANTEADEMEIEYKADPNEIFLLVPNSKMLKVNRALQVSGHYKLKLAALDLLDDHVSNKDLLSDLSHNQYASAINYQLNLALKCHCSVKYLNSVKDKASSLLTKMIIKEWGSSDATVENRKFISDSLKLIVDPVAFPEKYCWEEVKDSIIILGKFSQMKNETIVFEGFHKSKIENNKPEISRSSFVSYLEMVNKASNDSKLRYRNEWKNIEPLAIQVSELISKAPLPALHAIVHSGLNSNRNYLSSSTASLTNIPTIITTSPSSSLKNSNSQYNNLTSYDEVEKGFRVHEEDEAVELNESLNEFNNESRVGVGRDDCDVGEAQEEDDDNNKNMEFKFDLDLTTINVMDYIDDFEKKLLEYSEKEQIVQDFNKNNIDLIQYSKQVGESLEKYDKEMNALYQDILPDYVNERGNFHLMYKAITESKSLLVGFETMLNGFQNELASISKEMRTLQGLSMNENLNAQTEKIEGVFATGEVEEVILKLKPFDNSHKVAETQILSKSFNLETIAAGAAAGCATVGGEGSTSGTGGTSTSGSTSISTGVIVGNSSDWKDSSDSSADHHQLVVHQIVVHHQLTVHSH
ncbi:hypothetical protein DICPUDRAFT_160091 [Dictyostelium purpureum]|uniref:Uncharacterized protein n=1 Tax=Dictyostelium purpureum TaxID=5786 RepID=F1A5P6_DICPU|nr:uncharacterized protein DICPUDRAFT_160091 [Dictyostelium purpureum]EGC28486.1 hypothetical protein DICPUDRAFT_160091 [Dictyostelium purpureum]|eukprot:XP_003294990.1 hypothetical protein DICPUDRAFT_160091 [Dictyostelium purpureum]